MDILIKENKMRKIISLKGLPASGKSTWAKEFCKNNPSYYRVNKDDIRAPLVESNGGKWNKTIEKRVLQIQDYQILSYLNQGYNVIIDNTSFEDKHRINIQNMLSENGYIIGENLEWEEKYFEVLLPEAIERDSKRENRVGKQVILQMFKKYLWKEHPYNKNLPTCCIFDADGTIFNYGDKNPYDRNFEEDEINWPVFQLFDNSLFDYRDKIFIFSGRKEKYRNQTIQCLMEKTPLTTKHFELVMRNDNDTRKDYLVKLDFYNQYIKDKYNVRFAVDDRKQIKYLWLSLGIFIFDVNQFDLEY
jgi:predicted kinase